MRKLTEDEIIEIIETSQYKIEKKFEEGAVIIPTLIKAAFAFYQWLTDNGKIKENEGGQSRDLMFSRLLDEMKNQESLLGVADERLT